MANKYDYGIYRGTDIDYDYKDKSLNLLNYIENMFNRSLMMFDYQGLPDTIPFIELEKVLQYNGYGIIYPYNDNLYISWGTLGGEPDIYGKPTKAIVTNSVIGSKEFTLDKDCMVISNDLNYQGLLPIYNKYCTQLMENDITMIQVNINKRISNIITANDDNTFESARTFLNKITDGENGIIMDSKLYDSLKVFNNSNNSEVKLQDLIEYQQYVKASLYNEIGLNSNYNMKRERLISGEIEQNADILYPLVDNMLYCREQASQKLKQLFDIDVTVKLNSTWNKGGNDGNSKDTRISGDKTTSTDIG